MPTGELFINGADAYTWGMSMDTSSLSALMTPAGMKENIRNSSRVQHGERVIINPKKAARSVTVTFQITAKTQELFFQRYNRLCQELDKGYLDIKTKYQPTVVYHFEYNSCSQFTQFMRGIAKFSLKLTEYDPSNRT